QKQKNYSKALTHFQKSFEIKTKIQDPYSLVRIHTHLGEVYEITGQGEKAIVELQKALQLSRKIAANELTRDVVEDLSNAYVKRKNFQKAYEYQQQMLVLEKELFGKEKSEAIAQMEGLLQVRKKEQEVEIMKKEQEAREKELEQQRWLFIALGAVLLLTFALLLVVLRSNRQNQLAKDALALQKAEIEQQNQEILAQQDEIAAQNKLLASRYEELKELDSEKNYLIGVVAHDLQSPLNQIKGFLTILKYEKDKLTDSAVQTHGMIAQTVNNMSEMIRKILDLKAIESKTLNIKPEHYHLNEQLAEIVEAFQVVADKKAINLFLKTPEKPVTVNLDKNFVEQIFENLISNAIKFSPHEKDIEVRLERLDSKVRVHIQDEGPGIAAEEQSMLFKKFQKLSAKPTGKESSTGLGLSIVKKYVEAMNGEVWCESEEGNGADFIVEFSLANSKTSQSTSKEVTS
ncbi:MAG: tetratricopeptide repeat-containing sensor histidine kinase, partial [Flammeovirgaceae bacterium]